MTPDCKQKLKGLLLKHESYKQFPYTDSTNHLTIGIGRNLSSRGVSQQEAIFLLDSDIDYFYSKLIQYCDFFLGLNEARQIALVDMCFNLGLNGFLCFHDMLDAIARCDYVCAARAAMDSLWATQVGERAKEIARIIETGEI